MITGLKLAFHGVVFRVRSYAKGISLYLHLGDFAAGSVKVERIRTPAVGPAYGAGVGVNLDHAEADEGATVKGKVEGAVQAGEEIGEWLKLPETSVYVYLCV